MTVPPDGQYPPPGYRPGEQAPPGWHPGQQNNPPPPGPPQYPGPPQQYPGQQYPGPAQQYAQPPSGAPQGGPDPGRTDPGQEQPEFTMDDLVNAVAARLGPPPPPIPQSSMAGTVKRWLTAPAQPVAPRPPLVTLIFAALAVDTVLLVVGTVACLVTSLGRGVGPAVCGMLFVVALGLLTLVFSGATRGLFIGDPAAPEAAIRLLPIVAFLPIIAAARGVFRVLGGDWNLAPAVLGLLAVVALTAGPLALLKRDSTVRQTNAFLNETARLRGGPSHQAPPS